MIRDTLDLRAGAGAGAGKIIFSWKKQKIFMNTLSPQEGSVLLALFGLTMIWLVWRRSHGQSHTEGFLVADRSLPLWRAALSIAVSWAWAPAIFICSLQSYTQGLPGIFWFTVPNILCFFVFAPFALKLRKQMPQGYTISEFLYQRFDKNAFTHISFLVMFFIYQFGAIVMNSLAGGTLLHSVSGLGLNQAIISMSLIALAYSLISGLKASVFTDMIQMIMILTFAIVLVPWCIFESGGMSNVINGFSGVDGKYGNIFDPWVAFSMGIPMTLSLISGPFIDQMFYQRTWAVKKGMVKKTFIYGGLIFGLIPVTLSLLGFLGATMVNQGLITVSDPQMVGPAVVSALLPRAALYFFCLMAFAALCSTMDSAFCAGSSLGAIDIFKRYIKPEAQDKQILRFSRLFMVVFAVFGTAVALLKPKLLWLFMIYGAVGAAGVFPVMFAIGSKKLTAGWASLAVATSIGVGLPFSIYANIKEDPYLVVASCITSVSISLFFCLASLFCKKGST